MSKKESKASTPNSKYNSGRIKEYQPSGKPSPMRHAYVFAYPNSKQYSVRVFDPKNGRIVAKMHGYDTAAIASREARKEFPNLLRIHFSRPRNLK